MRVGVVVVCLALFATLAVDTEVVKGKGTSLKNIAVTGGELSPKFDPKIRSYSLNLDGKTPQLSINAIAADTDAGVQINYINLGSGQSKSGSNKVAFPQSQTVHIVTIKVTGADGAKTKNYVLHVVKPSRLKLLAIAKAAMEAKKKKQRKADRAAYQKREAARKQRATDLKNKEKAADAKRRSKNKAKKAGSKKKGSKKGGKAGKKKSGKAKEAGKGKKKKGSKKL